jgi:hypothetical protein
MVEGEVTIKISSTFWGKKYAKKLNVSKGTNGGKEVHWTVSPIHALLEECFVSSSMT